MTRSSIRSASSSGGLNHRPKLVSSATPARPVAAPAAAAAPVPVSWFEQHVKEALKNLSLILGASAVLAVLLSSAYLMRDTMSAASHLAEAKAQRTSLVCQDGRMVHGDESLHDLVFAKAYFVCTDWRTLQSIDMAKPQR